MTSVDDVRKALGEFAGDFMVELEGNYITVRAKKWLSADAFNEAKRRLQPFNPEWMKNGKLSHFRIVVNKAVTGSHQDLLNRLDKAIEAFTSAERQLREIREQWKGETKA